MKRKKRKKHRKNASNSSEFFFILACVFVSLSTDWQMLLNNCYQNWVANIWSSMESQQVRKSGFSNLAEHSFLRPIFPVVLKNTNALVSIKIRQRQLQLVVLVDDRSPIHCCYQESFCWYSVSKFHWWTPSSLNLYDETVRVLLKFSCFTELQLILNLTEENRF